MLPLAIFAFLVGAVLGMRWRVLVLLPTCLLFAAAAITVNLIASHAALAAIVFDIAAILSAHQAGYLFGAMVRSYFAYGARRRADIPARARV